MSEYEVDVAEIQTASATRGGEARENGVHTGGVQVGGVQRKTLRTRRRKESLTAYLMLSPSLIGVGLFLIVPFLLVFVISLTNWNLISDPSFVGLDNYQWLFSGDSFTKSLIVTVAFTAMALPTAIFVGLFIAIGLNRRLPGSTFLQLMYVLPWVCAPLTLGIVWRWMLDPSNGLINSVIGTRIEWMSNTNLALPMVAFVYVWQNVGYISLFYLAGLQSIPTSLIEAAKLDGAGSFRLLTKMYLPMLRPTTFFVLITTFISSFQAFDLVYGLTDGKPGYPGGTTDLIAAHIYQTAFRGGNQLGRASAMAVILLIIILAITFLQQRYFSKRTVYELD
ncbi:MAG: carbohydrate ABC transporter permease [Ancrocorticia sp.]|uniref:carbohydrate ABC transporter permease n=1 Tax=Ancrocorticia sp. TaxID=2593684 RepID=UPI003F8EE276